MSNNKSLPNFIEVANIKNLFWNNNSDLYPNCVPTNYYYVDNTRPVFYSPYVGTCILTGEFNHCIYNGIYYFLTKLEVIDIPSKRYKYQLDYDVVINFMNQRADVKGTLVKTNRHDILTDCLQTTKPILADPIRKQVFSYEKKNDTKWQDNLVVLFPDVDSVIKKFEGLGITRESYNSFVHRVEKNIIGRGTKNKEWLCDKPQHNIHSHHDPLIILEVQTMEPLLDVWKVFILTILVKWIINKENREKLVITKQQTPTDHFNVGGYVVGEKDKSLGSNIASEVTLSTIDISNITDIVPIDNKTKKLKERNRVPSYQLLPHTEKIKDSIYRAPEQGAMMVVLPRHYLPIANEKSSEGSIPFIKDTSNYETIGTWPGIETPQKITTNNGDTGFIWYLAKNSLPLLHGKHARIPSQKAWVYPSIQDDSYSRWPFFSVSYKNLPPLGFLIYQLKRSEQEWDGLVLKADEVSKLWYRSGLHSSKVLSTYAEPQDNPWWANVDESMEALWGNKLLARIHLDLDLFNWLSIAPSYKGLRYKYYYGNYWGYQKFFPDAGNREKWYPSRINHMNIKWGGVTFNNPYSNNDPNSVLPQWLHKRQEKLDEISIYSALDIRSLVIRKGDIVLPSLEHTWRHAGAWIRWYLPYNISNAEWKDWIKQAKATATEALAKLADAAKETSETMREANTTAQALGWTSVALGIVGAPFTGGASLALVGAGITGVGIGTQTWDQELDKEELATMVNTEPYSDVSTEPPPFNSLVLYLYKGEYRIGIVREILPRMEVSNDPDNLITLVNGTEGTHNKITVITPITDKLDYNNEQVLSETDRLNIIKNGYGVFRGEKASERFSSQERVHWYGKEDIDVGTNTFDLVGTDWYLVLHNGQPNLVPKSTYVFDTIKDEGHTITIDGDVSIEAKINQKAYLNYYGQVFPLNTKFTFQNHQFRYKSKPLALEQQFADPDVEYKWLQVRDINDDIDVLVTLPRKESRASEKVDSTQVLMMKERLLQLTTNYEQDKYANELMIGDKRLAMARQREDLDTQWWSSALGIAGKATTFAASAGVGIASGGAGAIAGAAGLGALGALSSMKSDIEFLIKYPTLMKRVNEDERNLLLANSQSLYQRKQNYEHDFRHQTLKLNKIAGSYQKSGVSNRDAQEKYNTERGVGDVFVEILLPSDEQQTMVDYIFNTFGCECVSDYFEVIPLNIRPNLYPGIYKFSRIQGGIQSNITDSTLREILTQILENGVKFEECEFEVELIKDVPKRPTTPITISPHPEIDPTKILQWPKELWDIYRQQKSDEEVITNIKKAPHYGLTDEEWEKYKDKIRTSSDKELLEDISNIISNRDGGTTVIIGTLPSTPEDLEAIRAQLQAALADKEDVERQLADCRQNIETYSQDIESLNEQLRTCKVDLDNAIKAQETVGTVNTAEIKTLRAKVKELEATIASKTEALDKLKKEFDDAKKECDAAKKECDDAKKKLSDEIQTHKEDKEDLTQQLNNERRLVLNKTDEVNRLTKEKENLENQKFDIERQLRECVEAKDKIQKELNKCKKDKPKRPKPSTIPNECPLMRDVLNDPYEIDIKQREGGLSRFIDLIIVVADAIKWMRRSGLDAILMRNDTIRPIVQKLEAFEQIPIVDKIEDITRDPNWDKFLKEINKTNLHNHPDKDVRAIYDRMREVSSMQGLYVVHGVKAALDDLNYLTYKAKETLAEELKTDTNLQQFFKHTYPGNSLPIYTEIFGSPDNAIIRKRFIDEVQCKPDGTGESVITILDRLNKGTDHSVEEVPTPTAAPTFMGVPLTRNKKFFIQPFNWFRDAKKPAGVAAFKTGTAPNGIPLNGVEAYNYPYILTDSKDANKKHQHGVFVYFYNQWGAYNSAYVLKQTGDMATIRDRILYEWRRKDTITVPQRTIDRLLNPDAAEWFLVMPGFQQHGTWQKATTTIGGKGAVLKGIDKYARDLLALILILTENGFDVSKWESGTESGGYNVMEITGKWASGEGTWRYGTTNEAVPTKSVLTWFMPTEYVDDLKTEIDPRLSNREAAMYRVLSWMYAVVSQPDQAEDLIRMMFDPTTPFGKFLDFKARP